MVIGISIGPCMWNHSWVVLVYLSPVRCVVQMISLSFSLLPIFFSDHFSRILHCWLLCFSCFSAAHLVLFLLMSSVLTAFLTFLLILILLRFGLNVSQILSWFFFFPADV
uniref:Uncharacterized protein n=1 Tax=Cacopsylla melanoneura TaxID=428564 RepID=A0A8D8Z4G6_9HEMI